MVDESFLRYPLDFRKSQNNFVKVHQRSLLRNGIEVLQVKSAKFWKQNMQRNMQTWSFGGKPGGGCMFGGNPICDIGGIPMLGGGPIHPPPGGIFGSLGCIIGGPIIPMGGIGGGMGGITPRPPIGGGCLGGCWFDGAVGGASAKSWCGLSVCVRGLLAANKRSTEEIKKIKWMSFLKIIYI